MVLGYPVRGVAGIQQDGKQEGYSVNHGLGMIKGSKIKNYTQILGRGLHQIVKFLLFIFFVETRCNIVEHGVLGFGLGQ
jgi:hypothetical protein